VDHMWLLQEKINKYLAFIESGEIHASYPAYTGQELVIQVVGKYSLSADAEIFYQKVREIIESAGFGLIFKKFVD
jgi:hypothetical protein